MVILTHSKDGIALYTQNIGNIYFAQTNLTLSIQYFQEAFELFTAIRNKPGIARNLQNLGETYFRMGDYEQAIKSFIESIKIKEQLQDKEGIASSLISLGNIQNIQKDYQKSLDYYRQALNISDQLGNITKQANIYSNIANIYSLMNESDSARFYHQKAKPGYKEMNNSDGIAISLTSLGLISLKEKNYRQSLDYLSDALKLRFEQQDIYNICLLQSYLSDVYYQMNTDNPSVQNKKQASNYAYKALHLADSLKNPTTLKWAYLAMKNVCRLNNQIDKAFYYFERYKQMDDSILDISRSEKIAQAEIRWNTEKKQRTIEQLENQKKLQESTILRQQQNSRRDKAIIAAIAIIFILTIGLVFFISQVRKRRHELELQKQLSNMSRLRLTSIRNRMSPHFFFNALESMKILTERLKMLEQKINDLSLLLRQIIENIDQMTVSLEQELSVVDAYINLYNEKMNGSLQFEIQIDKNVDR